MNEVWKPIAGYEGLYEVSSFGRIRSVVNGLLLTPDEARGYLRVTLFRNGVRNRQPIHRLVAQAFIPNPRGKPAINHKDEDKSNNRVDNLEWCTRSYNVNYGTRIARQRVKVSKAVVQYDMNGQAIAVYDSITLASQAVGISVQHIVACCKRKYPYAGGFVWRYLTEVHDVCH
jgi:hypothetical protein